MTRTSIGLLLVGALALGGACGKKDKEKPKDKPAPAAKAADKAPPPAKDLTPEQRVEFFQACWGAFNAKDAAKFAPCYAENAVNDFMGSGRPPIESRDGFVKTFIEPYWAAFSDVKGTPQVVLVSGNRIVAVELIQGTNTGEFMGAPATNKKVGYYFLHDFTTSGPGPIEQANTYTDMATVAGQLGNSPAPHRAAIEEAGETTVVIAKDDDTERANLELAKKAGEAFNAHDVDAVMAAYADDVLFRDVTMPADITGTKALRPELEKFYKAFPDIKAEYSGMVAAGDYVATFGTMTGTNKGAMPDMGLKKATGKSISIPSSEVMKFKDGKIVEHWMFANGMAFAIQLGLMPDPAAAPAEAPAE